MRHPRSPSLFPFFLLNLLPVLVLRVVALDVCAGLSPLRAFAKSWARWRKQGLEHVWLKLAEEYHERGGRRLPIARFFARRSRHVLLIDECFPDPSDNAAGHAAVQEIHLLQGLGYQVHFMAVGGEGSSATSAQVLDALGVLRYDGSDELSRAAFIKSQAWRFRFVYITRFHVAERVSELQRWWGPHARMILNLADLHYLREQRLAGDDAAAQVVAIDVKRRELVQIRAADLVLTYSEYERELLADEGVDPATVAICPWVESVVEKNISPFEGRSGMCFLGSFSHAPNLEAVDWFVAQVWPGIRQKMPDCTFHVYGSGSDALKGRYTSDGVVVEGWVESVSEAYARHRVFVAPLQSGAGVKGKVIGALGHGLPCVLSPVAAEGISLRVGVDALVADKVEEWVDAILRLYREPDLWESCSLRGRGFVKRTCGTEAAVRRMRESLAQIGIKAREDK